MRCKVCGTINVSANPACPAKIYEIPNVDIEDIDTIYVGRQGCACGCRGTYAHTSADVKRDAAKGHDSHNEPNDKLVLKRYARMKREAHRGVEVQDGYIFTIDMPNERVMRLYLNEDKYRHPDRNPRWEDRDMLNNAVDSFIKHNWTKYIVQWIKKFDVSIPKNYEINEWAKLIERTIKLNL